MEYQRSPIPIRIKKECKAEVEEEPEIQYLATKFLCQFCPKSWDSVSELSTHIYKKHCRKEPVQIPQEEDPLAPSAPADKLQDDDCSLGQRSPEIPSQSPSVSFEQPSSPPEFNTFQPRTLYLCTKCEAVFPTKIFLEKHERLHRRENPFKCSDCSSTFSNSDILMRHMRTHRSGQQLLTDPLGEIGPATPDASEGEHSFEQASVIDKLNLISQANLIDKPNLIEQANLFDKPNLIEQANLIDKPSSPEKARPTNKCQICARNFITKFALENHKSVHTGLKPFQCPHCDQSFRRKDYLQLHIIKSHSSKYVAASRKKGKRKRSKTKSQPDCQSGPHHTKSSAFTGNDAPDNILSSTNSRPSRSFDLSSDLITPKTPDSITKN